MSGGAPNYWAVFCTFVRNSLVREMTFRANFVIECISSMSWTLMNVGFYLIVFQQTQMIGPNTGWRQNEFFLFLATTMFVNSVIQAFFMPNCEEFSELIRTGGLDFALLKPIDTQFLISLAKSDWSSLANFGVGLVLFVVSLTQLVSRVDNPLVVTPVMAGLYVLFLLCGVVILYSLMISLSATSIWLGRNQSILDFWFYITTFSRYPMEIYSGRYGVPLRTFFTFIVPVLVVVNVPARLLAQPLRPESSLDWGLPLFALAATVVCFFGSRWIFNRSLLSYRSASS